MATANSLFPDFVWRDEGERLTLCIGEIPVAKVEESGGGWVVRTLLQGLDEDSGPPSRIAVPSLQQGKEWATRWAQCRQRSLMRATSHRLAGAEPDALPRA